MWSSKTTSALALVNRYKIQGKSVAIFKPAIDQRYSTVSIVTHDGKEIPAIAVSNSTQLIEYISESPENFDVIYVDEAFMIDDISSALLFLFNAGHTIVCSTLDLSASLVPFEQVKNLLPFATQIIKCTAVCVQCGSDAPYTYRKQSLPEIHVGGTEAYEPRCYTCHPGNGTI